MGKLLALLLITAAAVSLAVPAECTVYVNRNYYWYEPEHEWRYTVVDRVYGDGVSATWNANSDFGLQGSGPDYVLEAQVYVEAGGALNIGQGVTVKIPGAVGIYVRGTLNAQGSATNHIVFTSTSGSPAAGSWREIAFIGAGANASQMRYCDVSYGGDGAYVPVGGYYHYSRGNIQVNACSPSFDHCTFSHSGSYAFYGLDACQADISDCSFTSSPYGIVLDGTSYHQPYAPQLPIRSSTFSGNGVGTHSSAQAAGAFAANNTVSGNTRNVCEIYGGEIQNAATWHTMQGRPAWYIVGDVYCRDGKSISIDPDGLVKIADGHSIYFWGVFTAAGTPAAPIYITSFRDDSVGGDSNGDGSETQPAAGNWGTILLLGSGSDASAITHCRIYYGGNGRYVSHPGFYQYERGLVGFYDSDASISNALLANSAGDGVFLMNGSRPTLSSVTFMGSASFAVRCDDIHSNPVVSTCSAGTNGVNGIRIPGGTLTGARTWYQSIPYALDNNVWLASDASLTIQPGTAVKFGDGGGLFVNGNLQAVGTAADPIYFTETRDDVYGDTNNDGAGSAPAAGRWSDVALYGATATPSRLEYCVVRYGGNGVYDSRTGTYYYHRGNVFTHACAPTLKNCTLEHSGNYGIYSKWASNPVIENCTVRNSVWGIVIEDDAFCSTDGTPRVRNSAFTQNTWGASLSAESLSQFDSNNIFSGNTSNGLQVYGSSIVNETATWRRMMGTPTIVIDGIVRVPAGKALTITQNNVVKFKPGGSLYAFGNLQADGSDGNRIHFTSYLDDTVDGDTNADAAATAPAPGDWNTILFSGSGSNASAMSYCKVRYGARGDYISEPGYYLTHNGSIIFRLSDAHLGAVEIDSAKTHGIVVADGCHPSFLAVRLTGSGSYAIWQHITSNASLAACTATGNAWNGIYLQGGTIGDTRTWYRSIPYVMGESIWLSGDAHLTLQPGAIVKLHGSIGLYCGGDLQAVAEDDAPKIVFTSVHDDTAGGDTNGNADATAPAAANWRELAIYGAPSSASHLKNSIIRYAGDDSYQSSPGFYHYAYGNLMLAGTSAMVEKCEISNSGNVGIYGRDNCVADIVSCKLYANKSHGIYLENSYNALKDPLPIRGNELYQNAANAAMSMDANASVSVAGDNSIHDNGQDGIDIRESELTISGTWHRVSGGTCPFILTGHTWFNAPQVLTVEPGTTVKFRPGAWLGIAGQMIAQGTNEDRIAFTSIKDDTLAGDTNGDGGATSPAGGDYKEVCVYGSGGSSSFRNCIFRYGANLGYDSWGGSYHTSEGNVFLNGVSPSFDHCEFSFSGRDGVANGGADVTYQSCTFANNTRMGLYTWGDSDVVLNSCISVNNPYAATQVNLQEGGSIAASYCDLMGINYLLKQVLNQNNQWVWTWTDTFPPGPGNFSADPVFVNAPEGDFTLSPVSPCINTGDPDKTDPNGTRMDVGAYPFGGVWNPMNVGAVKLSTDGTEVLLIGKTVTAGKSELGLDVTYVEEADRSGGIKVVSAQGTQVGSVVNVYGKLAVVDGERALVEADVAIISAGATPPVPMHVVGKAVGGLAFNQFTPGVPGSSGTYNLGLLIDTSGKVTDVGTGCFWIDDGSSRGAEGGRLGVKVISGASVSVGQMVRVTGVSSTYTDGGTVLSVIRTRSAADVTVLD